MTKYINNADQRTRKCRKFNELKFSVVGGDLLMKIFRSLSNRVMWKFFLFSCYHTRETSGRKG